MLKSRKGFTLIEVLVVVAIIGVLATLMIPRFSTQPERGRTAEAYQMLGVLRRAQLAYNDENNVYLAVNSAVSGAGSAWQILGMTPLPGTPNFAYTCAAGGTCTATRGGGTIQINLNTGAYTCGGTYTLDANIQQCV